MADDKLKKDFRDRNKIAADEEYELDYIPDEHGSAGKTCWVRSKQSAMTGRKLNYI